MAKETKLTKFVKKTIEDLSKGLPSNYRLDTRLFFELSVVTSTNRKGGLDIKVLSGDAGKEVKNIQKIRFSVVNEISEKKDLIVAKKGLKAIFSSVAELGKDHPELIEEKQVGK